MDYAHNGKTFATGGKDNIIRIYDEESKSVSVQLKGVKWHTHGHSNRVQALKFMPDDSNIIISGGWDQNVSLKIFRSIFGILEKEVLLLPYLALRSLETLLISVRI